MIKHLIERLTLIHAPDQVRVTGIWCLDVGGFNEALLKIDERDSMPSSHLVLVQFYKDNNDHVRCNTLAV